MVTSRAFAPTEGSTDEPHHEEDDGHDPQHVDSEADAEEEQDEKKCQEEDHA